jgi:tRNA G10  N-methylase Trm11
MARASINLLGIKSGKILDPFCGIGGILLEAYDMKFEVIGNDISWNDLKYFKENFDYFYPDSNNKYFRILADVYVDGVNLADELIQHGHAKSYDGGTKSSWECK